ncbi:MAG: histidine kinase [Acidobacteriota bacterium]
METSRDESPAPWFGVRFWLLDAAAWSLFAFANTATGAADALRAGEPVVWWPALGNNLLLFAPWVFLTPAIFHWAERHPLPRDGGRGLARWLGHVALLAVVWTLFYLPVQASMMSWISFGTPWRVVEIFRRVSATTWLFDSIFLFSLIGIGLAISSWRSTRRQERQATRLALENAELSTRLAEARLHMLRAQLEPHFLFNALNSITALIRAAPPATAVRAVADLSDLLRYATRAAERDEVALEEELAFVEAYLAFQKLRFEDRLEVVFRIDSETADAALPPLVVQPLLENAIRHGVEPSSGRRRIELVARRQEDRLIIEVLNSFEQAIAPSTADSPGLGTGLETARRRLRAFFDGEADLTLDLDGGVATARVITPWRPVA